ncbi:MAG: long-chain-fatty-acid--CoA ligase [Solirubrobacteraceae bacterium]
MDATVAWPLRRAARIMPDGEAVIDGAIRRSWAEVHDRVSRLGSGLERLGVGTGERVAVLANTTADHLEAWLGVPAHGRVINDLNLRLAAPELAFMVDDCECVALLVDDEHLEPGRELMQRCPSLRRLVYVGSHPAAAPSDVIAWDELLDGPPAPFASLDENTLAAIVYTGGTSGKPKGVMLSHRNLMANAKQFTIACGHVRTDRYLHAAPMFHVADTSQTFSMTWAAGTHVILPGFRADAVADAIERERITLTLLVPTMVGMLVDELEQRPRDMSSLRLLMYAASPMPKETQRRAMAALDCDFTQMYGMTEAAPLVTQSTAEDHRRGAAGEEPYVKRLDSAGAEIVGVQCEVRDPATGALLGPGVPGEIWVRGPNVMLGYWRREQETRAVLTPDGWYRSGDMAYADDHGYLYIVDRLKDMIISGGENVYCTEVELALYEHPGVLECAVFGVPDPRWGERVHAVVTQRAGVALDEDVLVAHLRARIASYKVPRSLEITLEPLPKSGAGKILKRELRDPYWADHERSVH